MMEELQLQLPDGFRPMETQVAGHTFQSETEAIGLLQDASTGCVVKPMGKPACGERELSFYESLQAAEKDSLLAQALAFVPKFYKEVRLTVNCREYRFLKMEDLTYGMRQPCIMDIKIGKRTWDPLASPQKRAVEEQKYIKCKKNLGLCLPGFQVYQLKNNKDKEDDDKILRHSKDYGKQLDEIGFRETIKLFLNAEQMHCIPLLQEILKQLYTIRNWFNVQTLLHFYASSILIAYDFASLKEYFRKPPAMVSILNGQKEHMSNGNFNAQNEYINLNNVNTYKNHAVDINFEKDPQHWTKIKMIDFAHVFPANSNSIDTNYLFGLQNLITLIEELMDR